MWLILIYRNLLPFLFWRFKRGQSWKLSFQYGPVIKFTDFIIYTWRMDNKLESNLARLITSLLCLLLYHTRMLTQRLIENPSLPTCVKAIQKLSYCIVLDCFYTREISLDFSIHHFGSHWITTIWVSQFYRKIFLHSSFYRSLYFFSIPLLFKVKSMARQMNSHHLPF